MPSREEELLSYIAQIPFGLALKSRIYLQWCLEKLILREKRQAHFVHCGLTVQFRCHIQNQHFFPVWEKILCACLNYFDFESTANKWIWIVLFLVAWLIMNFWCSSPIDAADSEQNWLFCWPTTSIISLYRKITSSAFLFCLLFTAYRNPVHPSPPNKRQDMETKHTAMKDDWFQSVWFQA